jgi:hypothetical protein
MDVCVANGVSAITWFEAHRSGLLMLKRYSHGIDQPPSLSEESWRVLRIWNGTCRGGAS